MNFQSFTAGALRSLSRAVFFAETHADQKQHVTCKHLLAGLLGEENRAAELLTQKQLTLEKLATEFPSLDPKQISSEINLEQTEDIPSLDCFTQPLQNVILQAIRFARQHGPTKDAEVSSEHLLAGLSDGETETAKWLQKAGLTSETILEITTQQSQNISSPLEVNFQLQPTSNTEGQITSVLRMLDAAANRAREGVRVVEDYARFSKDDSLASQQIKQLRHDLNSAITKHLSSGALLTARNTTGDVGTSISTATEQTRHSLEQVLIANCKRVEEALRSLEEFGKLVSTSFAIDIEQIRYRFYTLEKLILRSLAIKEQLQAAQLYLLITADLCEHGYKSAVKESLAGGVDVIQLREKNLSDKKIIAMGHAIRERTHDAGALFIMNDRPDLAVLVDADGVHLGQNEMSVHDARRIMGVNRIVGVSTHNIEQARNAVQQGADYIGVGPTFSSKTKSFSQDDLTGLELLTQVEQEISIPFFAIGGITLERLPEVKKAGASRVAICNAICEVPHHEQAAREFWTQLHQNGIY